MVDHDQTERALTIQDWYGAISWLTVAALGMIATWQGWC